MITEIAKGKLLETIYREQVLIAFSILKREKMIETVEQEIVFARRTAIAKPDFKEGIDKQITIHEQMIADMKMDIETKKESIAELHKMNAPEYLERISELIKPKAVTKNDISHS